MVELIADTGIEFVKTSTGYAPTGAVEDKGKGFEVFRAWCGKDKNQ